MPRRDTAQYIGSPQGEGIEVLYVRRMLLPAEIAARAVENAALSVSVSIKTPFEQGACKLDIVKLAILAAPGVLFFVV